MAADKKGQSKAGKYPDVAIGSVYGRLTVIAVAEPDANGQRHWLCECQCGTTKRIMANNLKRGRATSCGCARSESMVKKFRKHGASKTPEYNAWKGMIIRCHGNHAKQTTYQKRGTFVCRRWRESFEAFLADVGLRPSDDHSIDRRDNDGSYTCGKCDDCQERGEPANCRWATWVEQMRNTSWNCTIIYNGQAMTVSAAAEIEGVPYHVIHDRVKRGKIKRAKVERKFVSNRR